MLRRFVALGLVGLFLAMSLVVAQDDIGSYDRAADVNGDGIVDILDLTQVGQAYGSNYTLRSQENKTVITVVSFANSPPEVESARIAVFASVHWDWAESYTSFSYTNASGVAVFELSPNSSYKAVAWRMIPGDNSTLVSYTDFETNPFGEASAIIVFDKPTVSSLPARSLLITLLNDTSGLVCDHYIYYNIIIDHTWFDGSSWQRTRVWDGYGTPVYVIHACSENGLLRDGLGGFLIILRKEVQVLGSAVFQLTEDSLSVNVIVHVPSSP